MSHLLVTLFLFGALPCEQQANKHQFSVGDRVRFPEVKKDNRTYPAGKGTITNAVYPDSAADEYKFQVFPDNRYAPIPVLFKASELTLIAKPAAPPLEPREHPFLPAMPPPPPDTPEPPLHPDPPTPLPSCSPFSILEEESPRRILPRVVNNLERLRCVVKQRVHRHRCR
jgi:hypothetical protein